METGYLEIFVYGARQLFPAPDAKIYVKKDGVLINQVETDESGRSERLNFETPPKSESTAPGTDAPYTSLDITIEKEGFFTTTIDNVQIFPGVISRLNTELVPIPDDPALNNGNINYYSKSQSL